MGNSFVPGAGFAFAATGAATMPVRIARPPQVQPKTPTRSGAFGDA